MYNHADKGIMLSRCNLVVINFVVLSTFHSQCHIRNDFQFGQVGETYHPSPCTGHRCPACAPLLSTLSPSPSSNSKTRSSHMKGPADRPSTLLAHSLLTTILGTQVAVLVVELFSSLHNLNAGANMIRVIPSMVAPSASVNDRMTTAEI